MRVKCFNAKNGDAIHIRSSNGINIFVDMGHPETYTRYILNEIKNIKQCGEGIDLLIITHIDQDHISGAISFLVDIKRGTFSSGVLRQVWHNSYRHLSIATRKKSRKEDFDVLKGFCNRLSMQNSFISGTEISARQGSTLAGLLYDSDIEWNKDFLQGPIVGVNDTIIGDLRVTVLTPSHYILKKLKRYWRGELRKLKYNFEFGKDDIFDDALEFYMLNETTSNIDSGPISSDVRKLFISLLENGTIIESEGDNSVTNSSSIAVIFESDGYRALITGDVHDNDLYEALLEQNQNGISMEFDLVKLSHHGSKKNNGKWLELVTSKYYLISTDSSKHNHPNIEAIANIILSNTEREKILCFNNDLEIINEIDCEELKSRFNYSVIRPSEDWGIEIEL